MKITAAASLSLTLAFAAAAHAQSMTSASLQAGLWETTITSTSQVQLPPEVQARIDAMPPQQQAMMKANMGGVGGGAPNTTTTHSCSTGQTSVNDLINQAQQKGTKCTLANQSQTGNGVSFDIACTMPQGSANGHSSFTMADSNHVSGTTHLTATMSSARGTGSMVMDSTLSSHYLGSDCGSVAPNTAVVVQK